MVEHSSGGRKALGSTPIEGTQTFSLSHAADFSLISLSRILLSLFC